MSTVFFYIPVNVCSAGKVPREPKLAEWTERATKFDNLKTPVGFISHYSSRVRGRVLPLMLLS